MKKRYFLEEAKCGVGEGGCACGPVSGAVVASVRFNLDGKTRYLTISELYGMPEFYLSDVDIFDKLLEEDENFIDVADSYQLTDLDEIELCDLNNDGYDAILKSIEEYPDSPMVPLLRYLIALTRCSYKEMDKYLEMARGQYADELCIPEIDVEEKYRYSKEDS